MVISPPTIGGEVFSYEVEVGGFITDYICNCLAQENNVNRFLLEIVDDYKVVHGSGAELNSAPEISSLLRQFSGQH